MNSNDTGKWVVLGAVSLCVVAVSFATLALVVDIKSDLDVISDLSPASISNVVDISNTNPAGSVDVSASGEGGAGGVGGSGMGGSGGGSGEATIITQGVEVAMSAEPTIKLGDNPCEGKKPLHSDAEGTDNYFANQDCVVDGVIAVLEQAGANVTEGYEGEIDATGRDPITNPYWMEGLCPVNVHWHLGAEHLSVGEFDDHGAAPLSDGHKRHLLAESEVREGFLCHHYDATQPRYTEEYNWQHCEGMHVGQTYEVHWPHSAAGACGTPNQYQTPFYDGVFCTDGIISLDPLNTYMKIGVQAQVYTIVNDENYYYPDMIRGMIVDGDMGDDIAKYTGSTTGTSRDNEVCSKYTPITWQVDRKCHLISASSFDKLCADMKAQRDDMSLDLHAHGARELVADELAANNLQ